MTDEILAGEGAAWAKSLAAARGLGRAHALDPAMVTAAIARGAAPFGSLPPNVPAVTEPAIAFDPVACAPYGVTATSHE